MARPAPVSGGSPPPPEPPARAWFSLLVPSLVYLADVALQARAAARTVLPALDEGVYLYAARLMGEGRLPYRDFFLGHPPFLMAAAAPVFAATGWDVPLFSVLYVAFTFSLVFPLWALVEKLSGSRVAALLAVVLVSVSPLFAGSDARFFALRQGSLPLAAWGLAALVVWGRPRLGGALLGAFSLCVATNAVLGIALLVGGAALAPEGRRAARRSLVAFAAVVAAGALLVLSLPNALADLGTIAGGVARVPLGRRVALLGGELAKDGPLLVLGLLGALFASKPARLLGALTLAAFVVVAFVPAPFRPHHLAVFTLPLALLAALLVARLAAAPVAWRALAGVVLAAALAATSVPALAASFFAPGSPAVLRAVAALERSPEPVLSFEPIYALHARRALTFHRYVADTRTLRIIRKPIDDAEFLRLLSASRAVLLEPSILSTMNPARWQAVTADFVPVFSEPPHAVLVRRVTPP